jgi:hypothetical protein
MRREIYYILIRRIKWLRRSPIAWIYQYSLRTKGLSP